MRGDIARARIVITDDAALEPGERSEVANGTRAAPEGWRGAVS